MATKVITGVNTRWSYANVWEAKAMEGGKPKFSVSLRTAIAKKQFSTLDLRKKVCFSYCKYVSANSFFKEIQHKIHCVNFNHYR